MNFMSDDFDDSSSSGSLNEHGVALSEHELIQLEADEEVRSKMKKCPICDIEFIDDSYFGETTCGTRDCVEEYEKIYGRRKKMKKFHFRDLRIGSK